MPTHERGRLAGMQMPSWREKRLLMEDETLQPFCWTYGTGELIEELARIDEIVTLSEVLQQPTDLPDHFGIDIYFEESFINSHTKLVVLLDRVAAYWNANGQHDALKLHKSTSVDNLRSPAANAAKQNTYLNAAMLASYKHATTVYKYMRDSLLRMRFLYEQLKPETQALIKCCSHKIQLQNSMIAQNAVHGPSSATPFTFKPACGFTLHPPYARGTLRDRITDVEMQISRLQMQMDLMVNKLGDEEAVRDALEVCDMLRDILAQGSTIEDPTEALHYATEIIAPQKHILERYSSSFKNTFQAFPDVYPSTCTQTEADEFLSSMHEALEMDRTQLNIAKMKLHELH
jgi:hypothetical protein